MARRRLQECRPWQLRTRVSSAARRTVSWPSFKSLILLISHFQCTLKPKLSKGFLRTWTPTCWIPKSLASWERLRALKWQMSSRRMHRSPTPLRLMKSMRVGSQTSTTSVPKLWTLIWVNMRMKDLSLSLILALRCNLRASSRMETINSSCSRIMTMRL